MTRLMLINGAPGAGKSAVAARIAEHLDNTVAVDIDALRTSLPEWNDDRAAADRLARAQAIELARDELGAGRDVVVGLWIPKVDFLEELEADAGDMGAGFAEIILVAPADVLARRLAGDESGGWPALEHTVGPDDAPRLAARIKDLLIARPRAERVDASRPLDETVAAVLDALSWSPDAD